MAFQSAVLPDIAAATTDLWPSIANTFLIPWRSSNSSAHAGAPRPRKAEPQRQSQASPTSQAPHYEPPLPDFMRSTPTSSLRPGYIIPNAVVGAQDIQASIANMSLLMLGAASNPLVRKALVMPSNGLKKRLFSSAVASSRPVRDIHLPGGFSISAPPLRHPLLSTSPLRPFSQIGILQTLRARTPTMSQQCKFSTGGISRNLLANREAAANRNPESATAQNAFYQVLLKANMPAIVVERYQSGRFARNDAVDEAYNRALQMIAGTSAGDVGTAAATGTGLANHASGLTPTQIQAVSQALAAQSKGSNIAIAKGSQGTGSKDGPIHVVVDESIGGVFFRWVKFILWFCLFTYLSLVVVTMMIDGLNTFKRTGGRQDSEVKPENQTTRFSDVHGCDEAKEELQELVEFLRNPDKFSTLGGKLPKGILLVGPPGTGKTLLARAVAGEAGVPFFYMSGSEFDEVYVGVGAKRVRDLFTSAKSKSPAIIFIDELDAIGGRRNARDAAYVKQTLNQLLTELDGFEQNSGVIIIAATNFPQLLDKALTRPGRFDRHVQVDLPDARGRLAILQHHAKKIKMASGIDLQAIAQTTPGLSGAELENIVNQAAVHASRSKAESVTVKDFDWARDKVLMGAERRSMVISPKEKEMTAYHEAGHALVSYFAKVQPRKLYKVTVLPRGGSLGHTSQLPDMDRYSQSAQDFLAMIEVSLGGKVAEEIVYGSDMVTSGVSSDLQNATAIAYQMVAAFGMSSKLGPMEYRQMYEQLSSETRAQVESEVQRTLTEAYERTRQLLLSRRKELDLLAHALVDYETLDKGEVEKVLKGEDLPDRVKVPQGPMTIPQMPNPLEGGLLPPVGGGSSGDNGRPAPPPPPPPGGPAGGMAV